MTLWCISDDVMKAGAGACLSSFILGLRAPGDPTDRAAPRARPSPTLEDGGGRCAPDACAAGADEGRNVAVTGRTATGAGFATARNARVATMNAGAAMRGEALAVLAVGTGVSGATAENAEAAPGPAAAGSRRASAAATSGGGSIGSVTREAPKMTALKMTQISAKHTTNERGPIYVTPRPGSNL